jgi:hypothetical protein
VVCMMQTFLVAVHPDAFHRTGCLSSYSMSLIGRDVN